MTDFDTLRSIGNIGENKIAQWLMTKWGCLVIPLYDAEMEYGKSERIFYAKGSFISPDMIAFRGEKLYWIEAKHKSVFSWHRLTRQWVTGIDLVHYDHYQRLSHSVMGKFMIMFLHQQAYGTLRDEPYPCPVGLFGAELTYLTLHENHRHTNFGRGGMVYWAHKTLTQFATLEELK